MRQNKQQDNVKLLQDNLNLLDDLELLNNVLDVFAILILASNTKTTVCLKKTDVAEEVATLLETAGVITLTSKDSSLAVDCAALQTYCATLMNKPHIRRLFDADCVDVTSIGNNQPESPEQLSKQGSIHSVREVFMYWQDTLDCTRKRFSPSRQKIIKTRLKQFSVQELKMAIDGVALSPFHCGKNDSKQRYVELSTIFRNDDKVEEHIERAKTLNRRSSHNNAVNSKANSEAIRRFKGQQL